MGICTSKKQVDLVQAPVHVKSTYTMPFKFYITSLRTGILTDKMIDAAIKKCNLESVWSSFFTSMFQYIEPSGPVTDIVIRLIKVSKNEYNGEVRFCFPMHPESVLNREIKINCPTSLYTIVGNGWAGISFIDMIKEVLVATKKIEAVST